MAIGRRGQCLRTTGCHDGQRAAMMDGKQEQKEISILQWNTTRDTSHRKERRFVLALIDPFVEDALVLLLAAFRATILEYVAVSLVDGLCFAVVAGLLVS